MSQQQSSRSVEIGKLLGSFVTANEGRKLRSELHEIAKREYVPEHTLDEYMEWMNLHVPKFELCGPQCTNFPWYLGMFTVVSQHVYGDCVQECLDKAMRGERTTCWTR